ncbi:MAG: transporter [Deltaproteobacteria bacterium]|nr:transporter [Deltaproteobacteria bacterium]
MSAVVTALLLAPLLGVLPPGWVGKAGAAGEDKPPAASPAQEAGAQEAGKQEAAKEDECPATFGPIITDTAVPIDKGKFAVQSTFSLSFVNHALNKNWRRVSAGGNFGSFGMDWKLTYGLWNNLEVFVVVPFVHNWAGSVDEPGPRGERSAGFSGLGDVNLTFKYRLVEETQTRPTVTALFATDFPSGHFRRLNPGRLGVDQIGGGAYVFTTGLNVSKYVKPFIFYGNLWYSMPTAYTFDGVRQYPRDFVTVNLAAEYPFPGNKKWVALLEVTSFWDAGRLFGHKSNVPPGALVSILPGIEYVPTEKFSLALGVNVDLFGKNADAAVTPVLSMVYCF